LPGSWILVVLVVVRDAVRTFGAQHELIRGISSSRVLSAAIEYEHAACAAAAAAAAASSETSASDQERSVALR
jgi:hypothetical protein